MLKGTKIEYKINHTSTNLIKATIQDKIRAYGSMGVSEDFYLVTNDSQQQDVMEEVSLVRPEFITKIHN